jgi:outer membrane receptor protein involved in Fe transport
MLTGQAPERYRQASQELRISSPVGQPIEYLTGVYLQSDHLTSDEEFGYYFLTPKLKTIAPFAPYLPLGQQVNFTQNELTYSAFGSVAWNITEQLKLSGGLRGISDHKSYDWNLFYGTQTQTYGGIVPLPGAVATLPNALGIGTVGALSGSRTDRALMPSAQLQYKVLPSAMVYFSYSRGFKAGGFNGADTSAVASRIPFKPEHVNAYEAGIKSKWFDNRVLINLDAFYMDYKDLQVANTIVQTNGAVIGLVNNAATSVSKGVEFEGEWLITRDIHFDADVTYLDAYYEQYPNASPDAMQQLEHLVVQNLSGRPTAYAPKWSGSVRGSYRAHLPRDLSLTTELRAYFTSSYFFGTGTDDPLISQRDYTRLDGRMTLDFPDGRWAVDLLGKNLTGRVILADAFPMATSLGSVEGNRVEPRSVAVQVRYRW